VVWIVDTLNQIVDAEVQALPRDLRARLVRLSDVIETAGLAALPRDTVKHLDGKLWELRLSGSSGIGRAIYVTAVGQRVLILRVFVKKSQKTPALELEIARRRLKEVK
jgi:phage-related protein